MLKSKHVLIDDEEIIKPKVTRGATEVKKKTKTNDRKETKKAKKTKVYDCPTSIMDEKAMLDTGRKWLMLKLRGWDLIIPDGIELIRLQHHSVLRAIDRWYRSEVDSATKRITNELAMRVADELPKIILDYELTNATNLFGLTITDASSRKVAKLLLWTFCRDEAAKWHVKTKTEKDEEKKTKEKKPKRSVDSSKEDDDEKEEKEKRPIKKSRKATEEVSVSHDDKMKLLGSIWSTDGSCYRVVGFTDKKLILETVPIIHHKSDSSALHSNQSYKINTKWLNENPIDKPIHKALSEHYHATVSYIQPDEDDDDKELIHIQINSSKMLRRTKRTDILSISRYY